MENLPPVLLQYHVFPFLSYNDLATRVAPTHRNLHAALTTAKGTVWYSLAWRHAIPTPPSVEPRLGRVRIDWIARGGLKIFDAAFLSRVWRIRTGHAPDAQDLSRILTLPNLRSLVVDPHFDKSMVVLTLPPSRKRFSDEQDDETRPGLHELVIHKSNYTRRIVQDLIVHGKIDALRRLVLDDPLRQLTSEDAVQLIQMTAQTLCELDWCNKEEHPVHHPCIWNVVPQHKVSDAVIKTLPVIGSLPVLQSLRLHQPLCMRDLIKLANIPQLMDTCDVKASHHLFTWAADIAPQSLVQRLSIRHEVNDSSSHVLFRGVSCLRHLTHLTLDLKFAADSSPVQLDDLHKFVAPQRLRHLAWTNDPAHDWAFLSQFQNLESLQVCVDRKWTDEQFTTWFLDAFVPHLPLSLLTLDIGVPRHQTFLRPINSGKTTTPVWMAHTRQGRMSHGARWHPALAKAQLARRLPQLRRLILPWHKISVVGDGRPDTCIADIADHDLWLELQHREAHNDVLPLQIFLNDLSPTDDTRLVGWSQPHKHQVADDAHLVRQDLVSRMAGINGQTSRIQVWDYDGPPQTERVPAPPCFVHVLLCDSNQLMCNVPCWHPQLPLALATSPQDAPTILTTRAAVGLGMMSHKFVSKLTESLLHHGKRIVARSILLRCETEEANLPLFAAVSLGSPNIDTPPQKQLAWPEFALKLMCSNTLDRNSLMTVPW